MWRMCRECTQRTGRVEKVLLREESGVYLLSEISSFSLLALRRSMLLRGAASALLRTSTEIFRSCPLSTVRFVRQSLRYPRENRLFSTSACLCRKKKTSLWLQQLAEGQTMDGNIEEILAPLRLAVKEQVIVTYLYWCRLSVFVNIVIRYIFSTAHSVAFALLARQASRLTGPAACEAVTESVAF